MLHNNGTSVQSRRDAWLYTQRGPMPRETTRWWLQYLKAAHPFGMKRQVERYRIQRESITRESRKCTVC